MDSQGHTCLGHRTAHQPWDQERLRLWSEEFGNKQPISYLMGNVGCSRAMRAEGCTTEPGSKQHVSKPGQVPEDNMMELAHRNIRRPLR